VKYKGERVMCRCRYPKYFNKQGISVVEDEKRERCYKTSFDLNSEGKCVVVISRSPKEIGDNRCDCLYRRIVKYIENNEEIFEKVRKIIVVNLFTIYEYSKEDLYNECMFKRKAYIEGSKDVIYNDEIIASAIREADYIIAAWGEPLEGLEDIYLRRVELVLKCLRYELLNSIRKKRVYRVGEISKKGYPKHCLAWSYNDKVNNLFE
jgi:hypothetical protein